jgi:hypothetical protein
MDPQDVSDVVSSSDSDDNTSLSSDNSSFYTTLESIESYEPFGDMSGDAGDAVLCEGLIMRVKLSLGNNQCTSYIELYRTPQCIHSVRIRRDSDLS